MAAPYFEIKPQTGYRTPDYPRQGYDIPSGEQRSFWQRLPKERLVALVMAGTLPVAVATCGEDGGMPGYGYVAHLTESECRAVLEEHFTAGGLELQRDYPFELDTVDFAVDGYDPGQRIGFDCQDLAEAGEDFEESDEREQIDQWREVDGPFFLVLEYSDWIAEGYSEAQAQERLDYDLRRTAEDFLADLQARGVL